MNITIYYLSKKIILQQKNQSTENQSFKNLDALKKSEILDEFVKFADEPSETLLTFETENLENGLEKFRKAFKYIYAAGGLIEKGDTFLFIFRLKRWDLPKGKIDSGETPEIAALREVEEECAVNGLSIEYLACKSYHTYFFKDKYILKRTFWYKMNTTFNGLLVPQEEENITKVEWQHFTKKNITNLNTYESIKDVLNNYFV